MKKSWAESAANARYFACLIDGSTDSSVTEQEVVYVFDKGVPVVKYRMAHKNVPIFLWQ